MHQEITLYNSLSRQKEQFRPVDAEMVTMYACGPTVYSTAHIGNFRTFTLADLVYRVLTFNNFRVRYVMNVTDVGHLVSDADEGEDKMSKGAQREGLSMWELAAKYLSIFLADSEHVNLVPPHVLPRATDHIHEQIALIQLLQEQGYTYRTSDGIYFDTSLVSTYGQLSDLDQKQIQEGARVEKNKEKRNPTDFALWKFHQGSGRREMEWESPWGVGFPGWHIECSAMSLKYLAKAFTDGQIKPSRTRTIDIHIGGIDHKAIHHPNEIVQSECATGVQFVHYWLHGEFLLINEEKVAKSAGNYVTVQDVINRGINPLALRYFYFTAHYRKQLNFTWEGLRAAEKALQKIYGFIGTVLEPPTITSEPFIESFGKAINDDINMPEALAVIWQLIRSDIPKQEKLATLIEVDAVLGLQIRDTWAEYQEIPEEMWGLVRTREERRKNKDYQAADEIRNELATAGYELQDTEEGTIIKKVIRKS